MSTWYGENYLLGLKRFSTQLLLNINKMLCENFVSNPIISLSLSLLTKHASILHKVFFLIECR